MRGTQFDYRCVRELPQAECLAAATDFLDDNPHLNCEVQCIERKKENKEKERAGKSQSQIHEEK
jgi:hypothetical protein